MGRAVARVACSPVAVKGCTCGHLMQCLHHLLEPPPVLRLRVLAADQEGRARAVTVLCGARAACRAGQAAASVLPVTTAANPRPS